MIKDITGVDLVAAVRMVGTGRCCWTRGPRAALFERLRTATPPAGPLAGLTEQEHTTLELIGVGLSNRQIRADGRRRVDGEEQLTVKNYVSRVPAKLGMTSRTQLAVLVTHVHDEQARRAG